MFGLFRSSPLTKLEKEHKALLAKAFQAQRNGDIRQYSLLTAEAESLKTKIDGLQVSATTVSTNPGQNS